MTSILPSLLPYAGYAALLLRVVVGLSLVLHGRMKLGKGTAIAVQWMKGMGVPATAVYAAIALEVVGGIMLIAGVLVPVVAALVAIEMVANAVMKITEMKGGYVVQNKPSYEIDVLYLLLSIALMVLGAGAAAIGPAVGL
jgi:putative oxidoreductase